MSVFINYRAMSWGGDDEDDSNNVWETIDDSSDSGSTLLQDFGSVGDPVYDFSAPATYIKDGNSYEFVFWNATNGTDALAGYPSADPQGLLNVPPQSDGASIHATAWYAPGAPGGPGKKRLRARTFDVDLNVFRKETPIQSATPEGAWPGPNHHNVFTEAAEVNATAKDQLIYPAPLSSQPPGVESKVFRRWQPVVGPLDVKPPRGASCPQGQSALAIAFFGHSLYQRVLRLEREQDLWGEILAKRGAEIEKGGGPWEPLIGPLMTVLAPAQIKVYLEGKIASLQAIVDKLGKR